MHSCKRNNILKTLEKPHNQGTMRCKTVGGWPMALLSDCHIYELFFFFFVFFFTYPMDKHTIHKDGSGPFPAEIQLQVLWRSSSETPIAAA